MKYYIGVDLGGTTTKIGLMQEDGELAFTTTCDTRREGELIASDIAGGIMRLIQHNNILMADILAMGIGCPAPIPSQDGLVTLTNLPVKDFDLIDAVLQRLPKRIPIMLINDADAAVIAESRLGVGRGFENIVLLTVGTGIGSGIIIGGKLYRGSGTAGEIGHIQIVPHGKRCKCGARGCLEMYASMPALIRRAIHERARDRTSRLCTASKMDGKAIFTAYFGGDTAAIRAVESFASYLAIAVRDISAVLAPELIILGGGVSELKESLETIIKRYCVNVKSQIKCAHFANEAGILGAALMAKEHFAI